MCALLSSCSILSTSVAHGTSAVLRKMRIFSRKFPMSVFIYVPTQRSPVEHAYSAFVTHFTRTILDKDPFNHGTCVTAVRSSISAQVESLYVNRGVHSAGCNSGANQFPHGSNRTGPVRMIYYFFGWKQPRPDSDFGRWYFLSGQNLKFEVPFMASSISKNGLLRLHCASVQ